jgi:dipeptidyl aminopeptidase/acylaminoacyl peptidase
MSNDLHDLFKKELDQVPLRPTDSWVPRGAAALPARAAWQTPLALAIAVLVLVAAVVGGRQLASFRDRSAAGPGVVAGKAIYLTPSFNGSNWIQIDPITLHDMSSKPLMDIQDPASAANDVDAMISTDGSTIIVGEFTTSGVRRAVYDGGTGRLRGYLTPEVPMVIDHLSADGHSALGRLGTSSDALTDPKVIISTETGRVLRMIPSGPQLWTYGVITSSDLSAIYYIVTAVPLSETGLDVSVQQPLSLIVQSTADGRLSAPVALPGMSWGNLLNASPPVSVGTSVALDATGRQLAFLSYDGATIDLVDTGSLAVTTRAVHRKASLFERLGGLVADAKEFIDQQVIDMRFTPDSSALLIITTNIHYGGESPVRTTRDIRRIEIASAEISADVAPTGGIYSTLLSPDGNALYLVVRSQEPPQALYVLRRLDARTLELRAERPLADYAELKLVTQPTSR